MRDTDVFALSIDCLVSILGLKNKKLIESCSNVFITLLGERQTLDIFIATMIELSKSAPEAFQWTLTELSELKKFSTLIENEKRWEKKIVNFRDKRSEIKLFQFNVDFVITTLKLKNKTVLEKYEKILNTKLGEDYTGQIFIAALFELSEKDKDTLDWVKQNLYQLEFYSKLVNIVAMSAVKKLIQEGFVPGIDFSATEQGQILINHNAKKAFIESTEDPEDKLLFQQILQVA